MLDSNLKLDLDILIDAKPENIWKVLTQAEYIKLYLFGSHVQTDWQPGSPIIFEGEYQGQTYRDKGIILHYTHMQSLSYSYYSGFSGLADLPENYAQVVYRISAARPHRFTWTQIGFKDEASKNHSLAGLPALLEKIKELAENLEDHA